MNVNLNKNLVGLNSVTLKGIGALTSKPYAFVARPWELRNTETIDILDSWGSWIRVDSRGSDVLRILPRYNKEINDEWISDKTRFGYEGLKRQRLVIPYYQSCSSKDTNISKLLGIKKDFYIPVSWNYMLNILVLNLLSLSKDDRFTFNAGPLLNLETLMGLKYFANTTFGSSNINLSDSRIGAFSDIRETLLFHDLIPDIEKMNLCVFIGTNVRFEAPILLARLRRFAKKTVKLSDLNTLKTQSCRISKNTLVRSLIVANFGLVYNFRIPVYNLGSTNALVSFIEGTHFFCRIFSKFNAKTIVTSSNYLSRRDSFSIYQGLMFIKNTCFNKSFNVNMIHQSASHMGALELGIGNRVYDLDFNLSRQSLTNCTYSVGTAVEEKSKISDINIYQGHNMHNQSQSFDFLLPGLAVWESFGTYMNTEGRVNKSAFISFPLKLSKLDFLIFDMVNVLMRYYGGMSTKLDAVGRIKERMSYLSTVRSSRNFSVKTSLSLGKIYNTGIVSSTSNFYQTDPITNVSRVMTSCTELFSRNSSVFW